MYPVAKQLIQYYQLDPFQKFLIGCGKGFLLFDIQKLLPGAEIRGIDVSEYAIKNSKPEIRDQITEVQLICLGKIIILIS